MVVTTELLLQRKELLPWMCFLSKRLALRHWHNKWSVFVWLVSAWSTAELYLVLCNALVKAVPWLRLLVAGPGSIPGQSMWDLWWRKWHWDRVFPRVLRFFPVNLIPPVLHYLEKWNKLTIFHLNRKVAQEALRLLCVRKFWCWTLLHQMPV
jgi:hypothetical protein